MIQSFKCKDTASVFAGEKVKRFATFRESIERKLLMLSVATSINDLRLPPGNRLEALAGNRVGQHSIRINDQFRICFRWTPQGPADVEVVDYH